MPADDDEQLNRSAALAPPPITKEEMARAAGRLRGTRKAPGPDGVPGKALHIALEHLGERLRTLFNDCLAEGRFPGVWKEGRLVLLRKEGRPVDSPSGHRPLVMLDEAGKLLERVLASRIIQHLETEGPQLSENQFGFRSGRSTLDALTVLKRFSEDAAERGQGAMAVSLDIANAFGSLPFGVIEEALRYHELPLYLRRIVGHYLRERVVSYMGRGGREERRMASGVPQGSVLGPLLWNIGFDWAIRGEVLPRMAVICYADDTMIAVRDTTWRKVKRRAEAGATLLVRRIEALGLRVALHKTEALCFKGPRWRVPAGATLRINGDEVEVKARIKYLGLILDGGWRFGDHFRTLTPRLVGAASALARLLPNLRGPGVQVRRLYAMVVRSMALYGAPIWAEALDASNRALLRRPQRIVAVRACRAYRTVGHAAACALAGTRRLYAMVVRSMALYGAPIWAEALDASNRALLRRPQRIVAVRACMAYRTVGHAAACALAGTPPWEIEAGVLAEAYRERAEQRARGEAPAPEELARSRAERKRTTIELWAAGLADAKYGARTTEAIRPRLSDWCGRRHGAITYRISQILTGHGCFGRYLHQRRHGAMNYRLSQILTGHGCFGRYLHRIRREETASCHECGADEDTAQHTLQVCTGAALWQRRLVMTSHSQV
ncbi:Retrovirus-related Pol polyprotein from type-1 retrotransposable element R1 [Papilio machaon]|uniref:Retrovirus-related Pol polyprotein from type-1 retrotransposable element R1 n=1 Tax=Papilio machaon TaxID=76193 RepID=A0A194R5D3_PAPMA|nr:Retrovirus-related Pol polyprotein from type-1 retrotransposable element R1 [Papilio machaon]